MLPRRWKKRLVLGVLWILLIALTSVPLSSLHPNLAILAPVIPLVINPLLSKVADKILDSIFGKEEDKSPLDVDRLGKIIGKTEAEVKQELEEKVKQKETHVNHILSVYAKWAQSYLAYPRTYSYSPIELGLYINVLPNSEKYYKEAREDLECYPKTYGLLLEAERLVEEAKTQASLVVKEIEDEVGRIMEQHNLKETYKGGREARRWYHAHTVIPYLIVKPIAQGSKYHKPIIMLDLKGEKGVIRSPTEGADLAGDFYEEEGKNLIPVFESLLTQLAPTLSEKIVSLQGFLKNAEVSYTEFKRSLDEEVIKPLENKLPIPNGGKCQICLSFRGLNMSG